ncbi:MAG: hypothetical protein R2799_05630 [Crocinitomicaceae bacterium]
MKTLLIISTLLLSYICLGQENRKELANSNIYVKATYINHENEIFGLQLRTKLKDTVIEGRVFHKFKAEDFVEYPEIIESDIYYESFFEQNYKRLDKNLNTLHDLDLSKTSKQSAILFGEKIKVSQEFVTQRNGDKKNNVLFPDKTPRKYFKSSNPNVYIVIISDIETVAVSSNGGFYIKQLIGDDFNGISEGLKKKSEASSQFDIQKGDEIQLVYRRKWFDETTGLVQYEDKEFKNIKYVSDTIISGEKSLKLQVEGYKYLRATDAKREEIFVQVSDIGYSIDKQLIPFKNFTTELKIIERNGKKGIFLQGVKTENIDGVTYQKIIHSTESPYRYYILPFFPVPFVEFGNIQGIITYSKIRGIEKGKKRMFPEK